MALSRTEHTLQQSADANGTATYTTGAITTVSSSLLVVVVSGITAANDNLSISDYLGLSASTGLTFTARLRADAEALAAGAAGWSWGFAVFTAPVTTGASTTLSANCIVTATPWDVYKYRVRALSYTGHDTTTPVATVAAGNSAYTTTSGANSLTIAAPASDSEVLGICYALMNSGVGAVTVGSGFTEIDDVTLSEYDNFQTQRRTGSTSTNVPWASVSAGAGTWAAAVLGAIEIKAAAGGGGGSTLMKKMRRYL